MKLTEREEQRLLVAWFRWAYPTELLFAIPNQLVRGRLGAIVMAKDGVVSGMPDLMLAKPVGLYGGLFIELKAIGGKVSPEQHRMVDFLGGRGYLAVVCYGFEMAKCVIEQYMRGDAEILVNV